MIIANNIYKKIGYPSNFVDICVKTIVDRLIIDKKVFALVAKKELVCVDKKSLQITQKLVKFGHNLHFCQFKVVFSHFPNSKYFFIVKIPLIKKLRSNAIYRYTYSDFTVTYAKTYWHFSTVASEQLLFPMQQRNVLKV